MTFDHQIGKVFANLQIGADVAGAKPIKSNEGLASRGVALHGSGFMLKPEKAKSLGYSETQNPKGIIRPYWNGRDINQISRGIFVIDTYPLSQDELKAENPSIYQHLNDNVRPEREQNRETFRRENWHWFGRTHKEYRSFTEGLSRFIVTTETSKHRFFTFVDGNTRADNMLVAFGLMEAEMLAML